MLGWLIKSKVKGHERITKEGKVSWVKEYEDKRTKKPEEQAQPRPPRQDEEENDFRDEAATLAGKQRGNVKRVDAVGALPVEEWAKDAIVHTNLRDALKKGLVEPDTVAVIDSFMEVFPDAWKQHFGVRVSGQEFKPNIDQADLAGMKEAGDYKTAKRKVEQLEEQIANSTPEQQAALQKKLKAAKSLEEKKRVAYEAATKGAMELGFGSRGQKELEKRIQENRGLGERVCCQAGGKCYDKGHASQCSSNCGQGAGKMCIPHVGGEPVGQTFKGVSVLGKSLTGTVLLKSYVAQYTRVAHGKLSTVAAHVRKDGNVRYDGKTIESKADVEEMARWMHEEHGVPLNGRVLTGMALTKMYHHFPKTFTIADVKEGVDSYIKKKRKARSLEKAHVEAHERRTASGGVAMVREHERRVPTKTVTAYKLFRTNPKYPGQLFPLFVHADQSVPVGEWVSAVAGMPDPKKITHVKSKLGPLAYRPGWHSGDLPVATHIGGKEKGNRKPTYRPANQVWAEVEVGADRDWQEEANRRGVNAKGKLIPKNAHITDQLPTGGHYRYKTNPNMTGNWVISGEMKVNRVLTDEEVKKINDAHGVADLPRIQKSMETGEDAMDEGNEALEKSIEQETSIMQKSHVKGYTRVTKTGKAVEVAEHEDSRTKKLLGDLHHPVYDKVVKPPKYNGALPIYALAGKDAGRAFRQHGDWGREEHLDLAEKHYKAAADHRADWNAAADAAARKTWGRAYHLTDYKISGIGSDEFDDKSKEELRTHAHAASMHDAMARAHEWAVKGSRKMAKMVKSHVKQYTRVTKTGKTVIVKEHDDKRATPVVDGLKEGRKQFGDQHYDYVKDREVKAKAEGIFGPNSRQRGFLRGRNRAIEEAVKEHEGRQRAAQQDLDTAGKHSENVAGPSGKTNWIGMASRLVHNDPELEKKLAPHRKGLRDALSAKKTAFTLEAKLRHDSAAQGHAKKIMETVHEHVKGMASVEPGPQKRAELDYHIESEGGKHHVVHTSSKKRLASYDDEDAAKKHIKLRAASATKQETAKRTPPLKVGDKVKVAEGSGLDSGKVGHITTERASGHKPYKPDWHVLRLEGGSHTSMPKGRLTRVD